MGTPGDALPPPVSPAPTSGPRLRRSTDDRVIGGVCGGLGRYLGVDPVIVRIVVVVLALVGGSGVLAYLIAWIVIPDQRAGDVVDAPAGGAPGAGAGTAIIGILLVLAGAALLLDRLLPGFRSVLGPLVLIAVGVLVLARVRR